jgi:lipoate---protein ligase
MPNHRSGSPGSPAVAVCRIDAAGEQAWNEQQLAQPVQSPRARLWLYDRPALVLGRSQHALLPSLDSEHHRIVERTAGGGAVLVGPWMLSASVVLPSPHRLLPEGPVADSYRWLGEVFVAALARHEVAAVAVPREHTWKASAALGWACFAGMSPWEVAAGGRKLVGFAQRRNRHGVLLVAGALLSAVPWVLLCETMRKPAGQARELAAMTVDAAQLLGRPLPVDGLADSVAQLLGEALRP